MKYSNASYSPFFLIFFVSYSYFLIDYLSELLIGLAQSISRWLKALALINNKRGLPHAFSRCPQ